MSNIIRGVRCLAATLFLFQMGWSYRPLEMMIELSSIFHTYRRQLLNHVFSAHGRIRPFIIALPQQLNS